VQLKKNADFITTISLVFCFFNEPFLFFLDPEYNNDAKQSAFPQSHQFSKGIHSN